MLIPVIKKEFVLREDGFLSVPVLVDALIISFCNGGFSIEAPPEELFRFVEETLPPENCDFDIQTPSGRKMVEEEIQNIWETTEEAEYAERINEERFEREFGNTRFD